MEPNLVHVHCERQTLQSYIKDVDSFMDKVLKQVKCDAC